MFITIITTIPWLDDAVTVERVAEFWSELSDYTNATNPSNITDASMAIYESINTIPEQEPIIDSEEVTCLDAFLNSSNDNYG